MSCAMLINGAGLGLSHVRKFDNVQTNPKPAA